MIVEVRVYHMALIAFYYVYKKKNIREMQFTSNYSI